MPHVVRWFILFMSTFALAACASSTRSPGAGAPAMFMAGSGLARLDARRYIVVNDAPADAGGPRLGLIDVGPHLQPHYTELPANWADVGGPAGGLEAVCAIPGRAGEFLAAEGAYAGDRLGRVFHFAVERDSGGAATARMIRAMRLPRLYGRIEGLAVGRAANGELVLILGEGGEAGAPAKLSWGPLELSVDALTFRIEGDLTVQAPWPGDAAGVRDCTDLLIDGRNRLWIVATAEAGQRGPFRSVIYRFGEFDARRRRPMLSLDPLEPMWVLDGFRVRAAALAPGDDESLCVLSDDGALGGAWRPLGRPRSMWEQ